MIEKEKMKKTFVTYVIEQSLFEIGGSQLVNKVSDIILEQHGCDIIECYKHPNYLNDALNEIYGKSHKHIINSIRIKLNDFVAVEPITDFLTILK